MKYTRGNRETVEPSFLRKQPDGHPGLSLNHTNSKFKVSLLGQGTSRYKVDYNIFFKLLDGIIETQRDEDNSLQFDTQQTARLLWEKNHVCLAKEV